jgi:membrane-associated phospholipid phosphatase
MTSTAPVQPPLASQHPAARPLPWIIFWLAIAVVETILLINNAHLDTLFWNATQNFLGDPQPSRPFWKFCRFFGNPQATMAIIICIFLFSRRRVLSTAAAIAATALAGGLGSLIRALDGRVRPTHTHGVNHWQLFRGFYDSVDLSFPSGHATLAFAAAAVLSYNYPRGKWLFIPIAAACAFSRVAMGAHFYSDVIFGSALGWTVAWWITHLIHQHTDSLLAAGLAPRSNASSALHVSNRCAAEIPAGTEITNPDSTQRRANERLNAGHAPPLTADHVPPPSTHI